MTTKMLPPLVPKQSQPREGKKRHLQYMTAKSLYLKVNIKGTHKSLKKKITFKRKLEKLITDT